MTTREALKNVDRFLNGWNREHFYQDVLDIQQVLCMDDSPEKLRRIRRRHESLILLKSDVVAEALIENMGKETVNVFKCLEIGVQGKINVLEKVIGQLTDELVFEMMAVWLDKFRRRSDNPVWD